MLFSALFFTLPSILTPNFVLFISSFCDSSISASSCLPCGSLLPLLFLASHSRAPSSLMVHLYHVNEPSIAISYCFLFTICQALYSCNYIAFKSSPFSLASSFRYHAILSSVKTFPFLPLCRVPAVPQSSSTTLSFPSPSLSRYAVPTKSSPYSLASVPLVSFDLSDQS
ncbi:hypothetical protein Tco_1450869 [Tanacetum coccineum]